MGTDQLVQIIVALGGFSGLAALAQTILSRQKTKADAVQSLMTASGALFSPMRDELRDLRSQVVEMRDREQQYERTQRVHDYMLRVHARWDYQVADALSSAGIVVDTPPPLFPDDGDGPHQPSQSS